ncbi:MAG: TfoX/Sxy family protein [Lachnospiraceae bacterium]|nr:TfoX/Sxy family protein [Lachnospiraceae bacterium]
MASGKAYLDFMTDQLSELEDISFVPMMGEYILRYRGKVVGGIYDDRFLVKPVPAARAMMPEAEPEAPYEGAKEMLRVDDVDDRAFLKALIESMYGELPAPKKKKTDRGRRQQGQVFGEMACAFPD